MINVSESIKKAYEESTTQYDKIVIDGQEYEINNVQYEDDCYYEGNMFGTAIARTLDFEIENIIDLENKEFEYLTGIKTENGIEWISLGNFITQEVEPNDTTGINKVNAMDYMLKSNITYESNLDYESGTVTMLQVLQEACQKAGIELATTDFANANFIVDSNQFDENSLIRQVFQAVAQISGTFAKVRHDNKLYFITPKRQGLKVKDVNKMLVKDLNALPVYKLSLANFKMKLNDYSELILKRNTHPINLVSLGMSNVEGENVVLRDEESITEDGENSLVINDNPFAYTQSKREQLITALFDVVKGFEYTSFEIAGQAKPYQETGDEVAVINSDGTYSSSFLFRFNYKSPNGLESEMSAPSITKATVNYQNVATAEQIAKRTELRVDKQEQKIVGIIEQQTEIGNKLTQVEQTVDGISQRVETIQDLTQTVEGTKTITLANCVEGDLLELYIYGNNDVFKYLYPSNDLYPSDALYPYGDSRIVVTDENNNSTTYELGVTDVLRKNGDICDEYRLEGGQAKVIRRINKDGTIKSTETVENLGEYSIRLKNGTNKISIKNYTATIKAKYAIQNDYTEIFSTKVETKTAIEQTAEDIDISVNKKLENYSTTTEMNSAINLKENEINQKVEKKVDEETITGAYLVLKINDDESGAKLKAVKVDINAEDVLNILAGNTLNLTSKNININSDTLNIDSNGNMTLTGEENVANIKIVLGTNKNRYITINPARLVFTNNSTGNEIVLYNASNGAWIQLNSGNRKISILNNGQDFTSITLEDSINETIVESSGIKTPVVTQTSLAEQKKNFEKMQNNALEIINSIDIYKYNLKGEEDMDKKHLGFIIGEEYNYSEEVTSNDNTGVDNYSFTSLCCKAIQEQQLQIEQLQKEVEYLKRREQNG